MRLQEIKVSEHESVFLIAKGSDFGSSFIVCLTKELDKVKEALLDIALDKLEVEESEEEEEKEITLAVYCVSSQDGVQKLHMEWR